MALIDEAKKKKFTVQIKGITAEPYTESEVVFLSDLEEILKNYKSLEEVEQIRKEAYDKAIEDVFGIIRKVGEEYPLEGSYEEDASYYYPHRESEIWKQLEQLKGR